MRGYEVLLLGALGFFIWQLGWFANPFYFLSLLLFVLKKWNAAMITSVAALLMALNTFIL